MSVGPMDAKPVFFDPLGRRAKVVRVLSATIALGALAATILFLLSLAAVPILNPVAFRHQSGSLRPPQAKAGFLMERAKEELARLHRTASPRSAGASEGAVVAAFFAPWQVEGLNSLRANASRMTHLIPAWLQLNADGTLNTNAWSEPASRDAEAVARQAGVAILPMITNGENGVFDSARVHRLFASESAEDELAQLLADWLSRHHYAGVNLDFENLRPEDARRYPALLARLRQTLAPRHLQLTVDLEAANPDFPLRRIAENSDFDVLMAYDQHWEDGAAGPIASIDWTERVLDDARRQIPKDKLVLGIGSYAYDWTEGKRAADALTFAEAVIQAAGYRDDEPPSQVVRLDQASLNSTYDYEDDADRRHHVWLLDGVSAYNAWNLVQATGVRGGALWMLGTEDPSLWSFFDVHRFDQTPSPIPIRTVRLPYEVDFVGRGEIMRLAQSPKPGVRRLQTDPASGCIIDAQFTLFPTGYVVRSSGYRPKTLVLTFDDGPDPLWTPQVLTELRRLGVPATFFVIGEQAERYPDLLRRMVAEGHEVGSHSFTHPNLGAVSLARAELELNATQRAVQSILGRSTLLFRPPYNADSAPSTGEEVRPLALASKLGYITVGESIDPEDWDTAGRGHEEFEREILAGVHAGLGNVILLHDGGGDRSETLRTLADVVPKLQKEGYQFVAAGALNGMTPRESMPVLTDRDVAIRGFDGFLFDVAFGAESFLATAFVVAILLGLVRAAIVGGLALWSAKHPPVHAGGPLPSVSVLVAAYNEEKTVVRTVRSVLASDIKIGQVVVVDDGSTDATSQVIHEAFGDDPRVVLMSQPNGGKASALNHAISVAEGEVLVAIDADTQLSRDAIRRLVAPLSDPTVGAVAGNVKVGNVGNLLTRWQAIEYTTAQNFDRRALASLNAITVVPGAIGAWRKSAVVAADGYQSDTLAEDMDLTWRVRMGGWRVANASHAFAYTEAPADGRGFFRQRFRWAFGTLQCLWKHRRALGRYGWFGVVVLPAMWVFQILGQLAAPLVDLKLLLTFMAVGLTWAGGNREMIGDANAELAKVFAMFAAFSTVEVAAAYMAYRLEGERPRGLLSLVAQRFVYRQLMYAVVLRALMQAVLGARLGWMKLGRSAGVTIPEEIARSA